MDTRINKAALSGVIFALVLWSFTPAVEAQQNRAPQQPPSHSERIKTHQNIPEYTYRVVTTFPHDEKAFTQGLAFDEGMLYEGTGLNGSSSLRGLSLEKGQVLQGVNLPARFFGEGITAFGNKLIQLTWRSRTGFVYNKENFKLLRKFYYKTEGWGITHDGRRLIMSDGSAYLYYLDPETYETTGRIEVADKNGPVTRLNELEYIKGTIYANVWQTDDIAIIDPQTGRVKGWIDLASLSKLAGGDRVTKTLNGIAYDRENNRLFITGKLWPRIYEIELVPHITDH